MTTQSCRTCGWFEDMHDAWSDGLCWNADGGPQWVRQMRYTPFMVGYTDFCRKWEEPKPEISVFVELNR